ncbi:hypothetical protein [Embleya sp. NPDC005971]|uniref:hypothetical protein n=1 Tax=Embleya sp. NPDC005971 TaxID=3156724 RepID=UPI0033CB9772
MEIVKAEGYVTVPGIGDVEVRLDLHDRPVAEPAFPWSWSGVISDGPVMPVGTEGEVHLDDENTTVGHPFVVITSAHHVSRIRGREHA